MASLMSQQAFRAARPTKRLDARLFFHACRIQTPSAVRISTALTTKPEQRTTTRRSFHTSLMLRATVTKQNPRTDEEGNEMAIVISERAAKRLRQITSAPSQKNTLAPSSSMSSDSHLRVAVTSGGCHGFQYLMSLEAADKIDSEEDTIFKFEDETGSGGIAQVVLDESSLELLKGSTVDFTTELIGSQFKIVGNPRATSSCGCGTSFDIE